MSKKSKEKKISLEEFLGDKAHPDTAALPTGPREREHDDSYGRGYGDKSRGFDNKGGEDPSASWRVNKEPETAVETGTEDREKGYPERNQRGYDNRERGGYENRERGGYENRERGGYENRERGYGRNRGYDRDRGGGGYRSYDRSAERGNSGNDRGYDREQRVDQESENRERPKLNLQPKTEWPSLSSSNTSSQQPVSPSQKKDSTSASNKARQDPFGGAKPREEVLKSKGIDVEQNDHLIEEKLTQLTVVEAPSTEQEKEGEGERERGEGERERGEGERERVEGERERGGERDRGERDSVYERQVGETAQVAFQPTVPKDDLAA